MCMYVEVSSLQGDPQCKQWLALGDGITNDFYILPDVHFYKINTLYNFRYTRLYKN